ncbi:hypothetical protein CBL_01959 [Carabus blaptoides fortunei]
MPASRTHDKNVAQVSADIPGASHISDRDLSCQCRRDTCDFLADRQAASVDSRVQCNATCNDHKQRLVSKEPSANIRATQPTARVQATTVVTPGGGMFSYCGVASKKA